MWHQRRTPLWGALWWCGWWWVVFLLIIDSIESNIKAFYQIFICPYIKLYINTSDFSYKLKYFFFKFIWFNSEAYVTYFYSFMNQIGLHNSKTRAFTYNLFYMVRSKAVHSYIFCFDIFTFIVWYVNQQNHRRYDYIQGLLNLNAIT